MSDRFAICICTYKRPHLLRLLLDDILKQTLQPNVIIVVDGDPAGEVPTVLRHFAGEAQSEAIYIVSNHANLAYQRYLGWALSKQRDARIMLYLDDDLRIPEPNAIWTLIEPLTRHDENIAGVTANIKMGNVYELGTKGVLVDRARHSNVRDSLLVRRLGAARTIPAGGLSPSGHRRLPERSGEKYVEVQWLRGGVMAYSLSALTRNCFSDDLFALTHVNCGLGEDTFLSRRVGTRGELLFTFASPFHHPSVDPPKSYPIGAFRFGYATAYSRRFLNDHYRGFERPRISDRIALVKSYVGTSLLNWWRAFAKPRQHRFAYALGYTSGAVWGLLQKPTARNLTPEIDWWADAKKCLANAQVLHPEVAVR